MFFINPFKGIRPTKENASSVTIASTDHLSENMKSDLLKKNPWSYLNVFNAEDQKKSKEQFELMKEKSIIKKDRNLSFYFYKISKENFSQVGIVGTAKLSAYDNLHIRGHEEIFFERSQKRMKQMDNLNAQIGPIYAVYPDNKILNDLVVSELDKPSVCSFEGMDKSKHEMWVVDEEKKISAICDLFNSMRKDGLKPRTVKVDGGMVANNWFSQFLSDIINLNVIRPKVLETTALGAAFLAGYQIGEFKSLNEIQIKWKKDRVFSPKLNKSLRNNLLQGWKQAIRKTLA